MRRMKIAVAVTAFALLLMAVGCAGSKSLVVVPMESNLSPYTSFYFSAEAATAEDVSQQVSGLEEKMIEKINKEGYFQKAMLGPCGEDCEEALVVTAEITHVKKVSGSSRFFLGAFAGKASLTSTVNFTDGATGNTIGTYEVVGESGGSGMSGGTPDAVKKTVEEVMKLIKENF